MASPFDPVIAVASELAAVGVVIMSVAALVAGLLVVYIGAANVLAVLRGEGRIYRGRFYSGDVWDGAMRELSSLDRKGFYLDPESRSALRAWRRSR